MTKNKLKPFVVLLLVFAIVFTAMFSNVFAVGAFAFGNGITVLASPSDKSKRVGTLSKTCQVDVCNENDGWYKIQFDSSGKTIEGYVKTNKLAASPTTAKLSANDIKINCASTYKLRFCDNNGVDYSQNAIWKSSNADVVTVKNGVIYGQGIGTATVTAQRNGVKSSCKVTVLQAKSKTITYYFANKNAYIKKSANESSKTVLNVLKNQNLSILNSIDSWYYVSLNYKGKGYKGYIKKEFVSKQSKVLAVKATKVEFGKISGNIALNQKKKLVVKLTPANATEKIVFSSSNPNVISVSKNGIVTAKKAGKSIISAKCGSAQGKIKISCVIKATSVKAYKSSLNIAVGSQVDIGGLVKIMPENSNDKIQCSFSKNGILKYEKSKIVALKPGKVDVKISESNKSALVKITVHKVAQNAPKRLALKSAYGDIVAYHPKCLYFANKWNGYKYWISFSPYKDFNEAYENPHILASNDLKNWVTPKGYANPLAPKPKNYKPHLNYNSDPELVYNSDNDTMECWWRYHNGSNSRVEILRKATKDGVKWSQTETMISSDVSVKDYLSPAIIYEDGKYKVWFVDQLDGYSVKYKEYNVALKSWSKARKIKVNYLSNSMLSWHLSVIHTSKGYEMVFSAFEKGAANRHTMSLYYAVSKDNKNFSTATPILNPSDKSTGWDNKGIYRSSLMYANGKYYLFYSGINKSYGAAGVGLIKGNSVFDMK